MNASPAPENKSFWLKSFLPALLIAVGMVLILFFGPRLGRAFDRLTHGVPHAGPAAAVESLRGWMTVPYIARETRVPEPVLWQALGLPRPEGHERSLDDLDRLAVQAPGWALAQVRRAVADFRAGEALAAGVRP